MRNDLLWRVRRINNDGILGLVVNHKIGIVVGAPNPYSTH
jgi:hypothetical protein